MAFNSFRRLPYWLAQALGLKDQTLPAHLATTAVCPVVDPFQRGYVYGAHIGRNFLEPANTAGQTEVIQDFTDDRNTVLMAAAVSHVGGAADILAFLTLFPPDQQSAVIVETVSAPINATTSFGFNIRKPVWIPSGFRATWTVGATGAAETMSLEWWEIRIPVGFIPTPF